MGSEMCIRDSIYCAAVHADRYNQLTKDESVMDSILAEGQNTRLSDRQTALLEFATNLSKCPSKATTSNMERLVENGLSMGEVLDLVLAAALFGWANRLMHVLGDPLTRD